MDKKIYDNLKQLINQGVILKGYEKGRVEKHEYS